MRGSGIWAAASGGGASRPALVRKRRRLVKLRGPERPSGPLRRKGAEAVDVAFAAGAGADLVAVGADPAVGGRLHVEAAIIIDRRAAPLQPGADPAAVAEDEVDAFLADRAAPTIVADRDAARAAAPRARRIGIGPEAGAMRSRARRDPDDDLLADGDGARPRRRRRGADRRRSPSRRAAAGRPRPPGSCFGSIAAPASMAALEHAINFPAGSRLYQPRAMAYPSPSLLDRLRPAAGPKGFTPRSGRRWRPG